MELVASVALGCYPDQASVVHDVSEKGFKDNRILFFKPYLCVLTRAPSWCSACGASSGTSSIIFLGARRNFKKYEATSYFIPDGIPIVIHLYQMGAYCIVVLEFRSSNCCL